MNLTHRKTLVDKGKSAWEYVPLLIILLASVSIYAWSTNGYVLPRSTVEGWPTIKPITAASFILLCIANLFSKKWSDVLTLLNIGFQVVQITLQLTDYSSDTIWLSLSSPATSALMIIANIETMTSRRSDRFRDIIVISNLVLFITSNTALLIYLQNPDLLQQIPGFHSFSWNSAFLFLLYATYAVYRLLHVRFDRLLYKLKSLGIEAREHRLAYYIIAFPTVLMAFLTFLVWFGVYNVKLIFVVALSINCCIPFFVSFVISRSYANWLSLLSANNAHLKTSSQKLLSQNRLLSDLTQFVSHNLRGPAVSLATMFDDIKAEYPKESENAEGLKHFDYNLIYLNKTVSELGQLLNLLRSDVENSHLERIGQSINEANEANKSRINDSYNVIINRSAQLDVLLPKKLVFTLFNDLISNSLNFKQKDKKLEVNISIDRTSDDDIRIHYADNSIGINLERHRNMLFKPGKQFHKVATPSSGLGMYRIRVIIDKLQGSIDVESHPNMGLTYNILIPIQTTNSK